MILIDIRETAYGKIVDVRLDNAALSFSMPYNEYCELERKNQLTEEAAIDSNIRFMSQIRELHTLDLGTHTYLSGGNVVEIQNGVSSPEWYAQQNEIPF